MVIQRHARLMDTDRLLKQPASLSLHCQLDGEAYGRDRRRSMLA